MKRKLLYYEDINYMYFRKIIKTLFPKNIPYKYMIYTLSFFHMIGTLLIIFGIFFPPKYLIIYIIYLSCILISYKLFDSYCFMTLLSNYYTGKSSTFLPVKMSTAIKSVIINYLLAIIAIINPKLSLYYFIKYLFS